MKTHEIKGFTWLRIFIDKLIFNREIIYVTPNKKDLNHKIFKGKKVFNTIKDAMDASTKIRNKRWNNRPTIYVMPGTYIDTCCSTNAIIDDIIKNIKS